MTSSTATKPTNATALRRKGANFTMTTLAVLMFSATVNGMESNSFNNPYGGLTPEEFHECVAVNFNGDPLGGTTNLNYRGVPLPTQGSPRYRDSGVIGAGMTVQFMTGNRIRSMQWARQKYGSSAPMRTINIPGRGPMRFFDLPLPQEHPASGNTETVGVIGDANDPEFTVRSTTDPGVTSKAKDVFVNGRQIDSNKEHAGVLRSIENTLGDNLLGMTVGRPQYMPRKAPASGPLGHIKGLGYKPYRPAPVKRTDGRGDALGQKPKATEAAPAEDTTKTAVEATWKTLSGGKKVGTKIRYVTNDGRQYDCALQFGTKRVMTAYRFKIKETAEGKKARDLTVKKRKEFIVVMSDEHEDPCYIDGKLTITQKEKCPSVKEKN